MLLLMTQQSLDLVLNVSYGRIVARRGGAACAFGTGRTTSDASRNKNRLGQKGAEAVVHCDNLFLFSQLVFL
jgi:hypothetical protein